MENLRKEMCNVLCRMGHDMKELEMCSNMDLMRMCQDKMENENEMMENENMSRKDMCMMLCKMGHTMEELAMMSDNELMKMHQDKMNMNMNNMNKEMMENKSSRLIKSWKRFK
jgi:hypothetical protein